MCMKTQVTVTKCLGKNTAFNTKMHQLSGNREKNGRICWPNCTDYAINRGKVAPTFGANPELKGAKAGSDDARKPASSTARACPEPAEGMAVPLPPRVRYYLASVIGSAR